MYHTLQMTGRDRVKLTDINFEYVGQFYSGPPAKLMTSNESEWPF